MFISYRTQDLEEADDYLRSNIALLESSKSETSKVHAASSAAKHARKGLRLSPSGARKSAKFVPSCSTRRISPSHMQRSSPPAPQQSASSPTPSPAPTSLSSTLSASSADTLCASTSSATEPRRAPERQSVLSDSSGDSGRPLSAATSVSSPRFPSACMTHPTPLYAAMQLANPNSSTQSSSTLREASTPRAVADADADADPEPTATAEPPVLLARSVSLSSCASGSTTTIAVGPNGLLRTHQSSSQQSQLQTQSQFSQSACVTRNPLAALYGEHRSARSSFVTPSNELRPQCPTLSSLQVPAFVRSSASNSSISFANLSSIAEPSGSRPPLFLHYVSNLRYVPATNALVEPQRPPNGATGGEESPLPSALFSDTLAAAISLSHVPAGDRSPTSPKRTSPKRTSPKRTAPSASASASASAAAAPSQSHSRDESDPEDEFELQALAHCAPPRLPSRPLFSREPLSRKRPNENAHDEDSTDSEPELAEAAAVARPVREFRSSNPVARTLSRADDRVCHQPFRFQAIRLRVHTIHSLHV